MNPNVLHRATHSRSRNVAGVGVSEALDTTGAHADLKETYAAGFVCFPFSDALC